MQSEQKEDNKDYYEIFEDKRVIKYLDKHNNDNDLQDNKKKEY